MKSIMKFKKKLLYINLNMTNRINKGVFKVHNTIVNFKNK